MDVHSPMRYDSSLRLAIFMVDFVDREYNICLKAAAAQPLVELSLCNYFADIRKEVF
jgi:hypothetical protein